MIVTTEVESSGFAPRLLRQRRATEVQLLEPRFDDIDQGVFLRVPADRLAGGHREWRRVASVVTASSAMNGPEHRRPRRGRRDVSDVARRGRRRVALEHVLWLQHRRDAGWPVKGLAAELDVDRHKVSAGLRRAGLPIPVPRTLHHPQVNDAAPSARNDVGRRRRSTARLRAWVGALRRPQARSADAGRLPRPASRYHPALTNPGRPCGRGSQLSGARATGSERDNLTCASQSESRFGGRRTARAHPRRQSFASYCAST